MNDFLMLHINIQGTWFPALVESKDCPLPIYIVVHRRYMADMTEEEWIAEYRKNTGATSELRFQRIWTNITR